ncbi:hypothetical protein [Billgrantia aerodenitrificans]|uniref:Myb-like domain-containing protein n=1 Tax=Billgrantia aerodenitrificans TaxID=2733483 RepID=A0ABS9AUW6_9GAMM|nr:hypothetical protein [Halomonas aerodenitrificans]MCE8025315.1 hypothetical protein [Halomonas aerodenitrificans]
MTKRKPPPSQEWMLDELELLERHYRVLTAQELQERYLPNRSLKAIYKMAGRLKLKKLLTSDPSPGLYRSWPKEELEILRQHYLSLSAPEIKRRYLPHRTVIAIRRMAKQAGLSKWKPHVWTKGELRMLRELFPKGGAAAVHAALPQRALGTIRAKARSLDLLYQDRRNPTRWSADEVQRLKQLDHLSLEQLQKHFPKRTRSSLNKMRFRLRHKQLNAT